MLKHWCKPCENEENHCHFEMPQTSAPSESLSEATLAELRDLRRLGEKTSGSASDMETAVKAAFKKLFGCGDGISR